MARPETHVDSAIDAVVAEFVSTFELRPARRVATADGARWSTDGEPIVELVVGERGKSRVIVHDINLLRPLRTRLRTRRVQVEHIGGPLSRE